MSTRNIYVLTYNQYEKYEGTYTRIIAVSESVDSLKSKASEDTNIFAEIWQEEGDDRYSLTVGDSNSDYENFYYIRKCELV